MEVTQLVIVAKCLAEFANVADKELNGGGLFGLFGLTGPVGDLKKVDFAVLKTEVAALSDEGRKEVEAAFNENLNLTNPAIQTKVLQGEKYLESVIALGEKAVALFNEGKALEAQIQAFIGV